MRQDPEVMTGARGPRTERLEKMREADAAATSEPAQLPKIKRPGTTYVSTFRRYRHPDLFAFLILGYNKNLWRRSPLSNADRNGSFCECFLTSPNKEGQGSDEQYNTF